MSSESDTIAAIGTAPGEAGIAVTRISGPAAFRIADSIFRCSGEPPSKRPHGTFTYGKVFDDAGAAIDSALLLIMRAPRSYTGEDTAEIQSHGSSIITQRILRRALECGARSAEPGEFTKRAFLNGKLDLLQAEAVLDLIRARSDRAAASAREQLNGSLTRLFTGIYGGVLAVAAEIEATLDFADEELPEGIAADAAARLRGALADAESLLATWDEGHLLRDGASVVIAGKPNVGKSTLMNALLGRDRAIVSEIPGTTRDVIEEGFVLSGFPVRLIDTAGLRDSECSIEQEGMRRSRLQMASADIHLHVVDVSQPMDGKDAADIAGLDPMRTIIVLNKTDLPRGSPPHSRPQQFRVVETSLKSGSGLAELKKTATEILLSSHGLGEPHRASISERHRDLLLNATASLSSAAETLDHGLAQAEIAASHLRHSLTQLGRITGQIYDEELMSSIFSRFCIGK